MQRSLFGTDGIRGVANKHPMTGEVAMALGRAVTHYFQSRGGAYRHPLIILGKDTRRSCYMLEQAFSAGVCSQGGKVVLTGPLPTPGVAFVTQSMRANAGVMISASHNSFEDNGIKIFDAFGNKLPDEVELELEKMVFNAGSLPIPYGEHLGKAKRLDEVIGRYIVHVKSTFSPHYNLEGMRIVLDCANGAGYRVAPMILSELGAEVFTLGVSPNGVNINLDCGSTRPENAQKMVKELRADLGVCLDGDADRLAVIDAQGDLADGDRLIGLFARYLLDTGELTKGDSVVGTVMSNLGVETYIKSLNLNFIRAKVGDRYILQHLREQKSKFGGEPSGHLIFHRHSSTGDGLVAALKAIECMKFYDRPIKDLLNEIPIFPQAKKNIKVGKRIPLEEVQSLQKLMKKIELSLGDRGRVLIRYSGTEPLLRIMIEGEDEKKVSDCCQQLADMAISELS